MGAAFQNGPALKKRFALEHFGRDLTSASEDKVHRHKHRRLSAQQKGSGLPIEMASLVLAILPQRHATAVSRGGIKIARVRPQQLVLPSKPTAHGEPLIRREYEGFFYQRDDLLPFRASSLRGDG